MKPGVTLLILLLAPPLTVAAAEPAAFFNISEASRDGQGGLVLRWPSETNAFTNTAYTLESSTNPAAGFLPAAGPFPPTPPVNVHTAALTTVLRTYYRVAAPSVYPAIDEPGAWDAYDAGNTDGLNARGFVGAIFDGRYVYFPASQNSNGASGIVLRYDTRGVFTNAASWRAHDASATDGLNTRGYQGGVCDGRYLYLVPVSTSNAPVLRLDTHGEFTNAASWDAYDAGATDGLSTRGFQGSIFDGRFIYFAPHADSGGFHGRVLRLDTHAPFTNAASWRAYDAGATGGLGTQGYSGGAFDGRHVYFAPTATDGPVTHGRVLRLDTQGDFTNAASWRAFDAGNTTVADTKGFKGAVYDGRFVYFIQFQFSPSGGRMLRYDTQGDFTNAASWTGYDAGNTDGLATRGYQAGIFDGRHIWFVPNNNGVAHGFALRYDTQGAFTNAASWRAYDAGATDGLSAKGYEGAALDGRYIYFAPYRNGAPYNGVVLRFDARLPRHLPPAQMGGSTF